MALPGTRSTAYILSERFGDPYLGNHSRYRDETKRALKATPFPLSSASFSTKIAAAAISAFLLNRQLIVRPTVTLEY